MELVNNFLDYLNLKPKLKMDICILYLGKSTLVKMIQGVELPDSGEIKIGDTVKLAVVDQDRDGLFGDQSVFEEISGGADYLQLGNTEISSRAYISWFGFKGSDRK